VAGARAVEPPLAERQQVRRHARRLGLVAQQAAARRGEAQPRRDGQATRLDPPPRAIGAAAR
jgi:hypothetical protein